MTMTTVNIDRQHVLTQNILRPSKQIFVDQYELSLRGQLPNSRGSEPQGTKYCSGTLFYDAASQLIQIFHQPSLGSSDALNSKIKFEKEAVHCGITINAYHMDNGIFTKAQFRKAQFCKADQVHTVSSVRVHHQNGSAECTIKTIQDMSHAMMIHLLVHWPDEYHVDLWPFAMDYAVWLYNHTPQCDSGLAPMEFFCSIRLNCEYL